MIIRSIRPTDVDQCFDLATRVFVEGSTLHRALDVQLDEYREYLWPSFCSMIDEELSVVAVDKGAERILGCLIMTGFHPVAMPPSHSKDKFAPLAALTSELVGRYLSKRTLAEGEAVLVDMGAVASEATGRGAYKTMRLHASQIARDRGFRLILGELSSAATQQVVLNRMGHRKRAEVDFASFEYNGTRPFSSIRNPPSIVLSEGDLAQAE